MFLQHDTKIRTVCGLLMVKRQVMDSYSDLLVKPCAATSTSDQTFYVVQYITKWSYTRRIGNRT